MFGAKQILFPADGSELSFAFAPQVLTVAGWLDAGITLLYVKDAQGPGHRERSVEQLAQLLDRGAPWRVRMRTGTGPAAQTIAELAASDAFDLIMMPAHSRGAASRLVKGSVAEQVVRTCRCPVWVARGDRAVQRRQFRNIVCALDLAGDSSAVLSGAAQLASSCGGDLSIVHAMPDMEENLLQLAACEELMPTLSPDKARRELARLQRLTGTHANVDLEICGVVTAVKRVLKRTKGDVLVVGPGQHSARIGRNGSNVLPLLRAAHVPVVVLEKDWQFASTGRQTARVLDFAELAVRAHTR